MLLNSKECPVSPAQRTLLLGSHLDTVRDAGKYDGLLGVMIALACLERLHERDERLPFALELLGFADEEGLRYQCPLYGQQGHDRDCLTRETWNCAMPTGFLCMRLCARLGVIPERRH